MIMLLLWMFMKLVSVEVLELVGWKIVILMFGVLGGFGMMWFF